MAKLHDDCVTTPADLQRALKKQVTELQKGDVVLIHTGLMTVWPDSKEFVPNHPGINVESAAWLIDHGAVILGADNMAVEQVHLDKESVHSYVFADRSILWRWLGLNTWPKTKILNSPLSPRQSNCGVQPALRSGRLRCRCG